MPAKRQAGEKVPEAKSGQLQDGSSFPRVIGVVSTSPKSCLIELTSKAGCKPTSALLEFLDASGIWAEWISASDQSAQTEGGGGASPSGSADPGGADGGLVRVSALVRSDNPIDEAALFSLLKGRLGDRLVEAKVFPAPALSQGFPPVLRIDRKDRRCLVLTDSDAYALFRGMQELFGTGAAVVLYNLGKDIGIRCYSSSYSSIGEERGALEHCFRMRQLLGFGRFRILGWEGRVPTRVLVEDCTECRIIGKVTVQEPALVKGYLEGSISAATGAIVRAVEEECIRKGDPSCTFRIDLA